MDICFEWVCNVGKGELWSVAQYARAKVGGDVMRDPDIEVMRFPSGEWFPWSYRNDFLGTFETYIGLDVEGRPVGVDFKRLYKCREILESMVSEVLENNFHEYPQEEVA